MTLDPQPTVLVVDDNEALRYALVRALQVGGYNVLQAASGTEAIRLASQSPDLITLDIKLPDIDGYEVCRRLRALPETRRIPILHISASFVAPEHKIKALEGGADGYLAEPITKDELLATVRSLLRMKTAEEEAHRREREFRFLADSIPHLVWITDSEGKPRYFNVRWYEFTGLRQDEPISANGWLEIVHPDDVARLLELWRESIRTGERFQAEARYRSATGDYRWMSIRAARMQKGGTEKAEWFGTSTDITEEKRTRDILRQTERMALAGRLAASIAHEINNPLEAIMNIFYLLETSKDLPAPMMNLVQLGLGELRRVSHIVRQSLAYYRSSDKLAEIDLVDVLEDTIKVLDTRFTAHRISLVRRYETHSKVRVFASEIRQVFSNLILNAIEATPDDGRLVIKVSDHKNRRNGSSSGVRVTIGDNGSGIAPTARSRIFDAFFTTKTEKGTGLGLWVSNDLVKKHGGYVRVRSCVVPEKSGTVFSVFLPCA